MSLSLSFMLDHSLSLKKQRTQLSPSFSVTLKIFFSFFFLSSHSQTSEVLTLSLVTSGVPRIFKRAGGIQPQSIMLSGKIFQGVKKGLYFESLSVLSIFLPENLVISLKKEKKKVYFLNRSLIFCISDLQGGHGTIPPPPLNTVLFATDSER